MRHLAVVVNPRSGRRGAERVAARSVDLLTRRGVVVHEVRGPDPEAVRRSLARLAPSVDGVVVVGGDGAVHAVLPVLLDHDLALGIAPAGTGNDLARSLGVPIGDPEAATRAVLGRAERRIDLALSGDRPVATIVAAGIDSAVNERAQEMRWPRGPARYRLALAAELVRLAPRPFRLELDGEVVELDAMLVAVANGPCFGGGLRIAEGAELDDGLLDVCVVAPMARRTFVRLYPLLRRGEHTDLEQFRRYRVRRVVVDAPGVVAYGDGERLGPLPRTTRVLPGALRVLGAAPGP